MRNHETSPTQGRLEVDPEKGALVVHEAPSLEEAFQARPLRLGSFYNGQPIRNDRELREANATEQKRVDAAYRAATLPPTDEEAASAATAREQAHQVADAAGSQEGSKAAPSDASSEVDLASTETYVQGRMKSEAQLAAARARLEATPQTQPTESAEEIEARQEWAREQRRKRRLLDA